MLKIVLTFYVVITKMNLGRFYFNEGLIEPYSVAITV